MNDVAIININMGNLFSIKCALDYVGLKSIITDDDKIIKNSKCEYLLYIIFSIEFLAFAIRCVLNIELLFSFFIIITLLFL